MLRVSGSALAISLALLTACSGASSSGFEEGASPGSGPSSGSSPSSTDGTGKPTGALGGNSFGGPGSGSCVPGSPRAFVNAVCTCSDLNEIGVLTTSAPPGGTASVEVNGRVNAATGATIAGNFTPYGGLLVGGDVKVDGDVSTTGTVDGIGVFHIGGDLSVGGGFTFGGLYVDGTVMLAQPASVVIPIHDTMTGSYVAPSGPPCDCDSGSLLPIADSVQAAAAKNDNAKVGISSNGGDLASAGTLTLPSGTYYFDDLTKLNVGTITIQGNVAIYFSGGSLDIGIGQFSIAPGSSLDIYVDGVLGSIGGVELGDTTDPQAFRLFIGGAGSMSVTGGAQAWNGLIYAPQADIAFVGVTEVHGAVFANSITWGGDLDVSYVGGVLAAPSNCPSPPPLK